MDKEKKISAVPLLNHKLEGRQQNEPAELHSRSSPQIPPDPNGPKQSFRGNPYGPKQIPSNTKGDALKSHSYSGSHHVRETSKDNDSLPHGRDVLKNYLETHKKGPRAKRSTPTSAEKPKSAQENFVSFEATGTDFPELAGHNPVQRVCWGPTYQSTSPKHPGPPQIAANAKPDLSMASPVQTVMTSWANVASQPPRKPFPKETVDNTHMQIETIGAKQEDGTKGKRKRKKNNKKAKQAVEDAETESEVAASFQEPPKFEDEEEFPGLTLALTKHDAKVCNEEKQRVLHQFADETRETSPALKPHPAEMAKKGQKAEKVSGKKSKVPVQLDIGIMLAALEKKQQSQKTKQDTKPVVHSVAAGLPVVQKQHLVQKKPPWQQDKVAHNPLDSTSPLVKKGKQREVPKAKKPTPLKKVILKEREERKQRRLLEEMGLLPDLELQPTGDPAEEDQSVTDPSAADVGGNSVEETNDETKLNAAREEEEEEADREKVTQQLAVASVPCPAGPPKIHSRKFRDYCSQMLSKDVDECATALLKELVRFQDRLYQKDPMKARMKRRIVMGLREVLKHLKLRKVKCVVISPNCERIQSKGGLDEALYTIIDICREQGVPFVFALSRKALGRCVNKSVPVSLVGIFNYDGAQDFYHKMVELSSEARKAYEVMVSSLEWTEQAADGEEGLQIGGLAEEAQIREPEEPDYIKAWRKLLEKDCNHTFLNFEEQLSSMHLESESTENTEEEHS